jgi:peptidoglycan/xylan/chitin deacetylase (PgdA/CDA1 family)
MYPVRIPNIIKTLYPRILWKMPESTGAVYLTFDDGPTPEQTAWILDTLGAFGARATFFCLGAQAEKHPELIDRIRAAGHSLGHHSYSHPNGWKTSTGEYITDIEKGAKFIPSSVFRPPYGLLRPAQYRELIKRYPIIEWSLMPGDYDHTISSDSCFKRVSENVEAGDIICLHDSVKSAKHLRACLPGWLKLFAEKGLSCQALTETGI